MFTYLCLVDLCLSVVLYHLLMTSKLSQVDLQNLKSNNCKMSYNIKKTTKKSYNCRASYTLAKKFLSYIKRKSSSNEFGYRNENVLLVKVGYFKKSRLTNYDKMRILKIGVQIFIGASCKLC